MVTSARAKPIPDLLDVEQVPRLGFLLICLQSPLYLVSRLSLFLYPSFSHHPQLHNVQIGPPVLKPFAGNSLAEHMGNYRGDFTCHLGSNIESNFKRTLAKGYIYLACLCWVVSYCLSGYLTSSLLVFKINIHLLTFISGSLISLYRTWDPRH